MLTQLAAAAAPEATRSTGAVTEKDRMHWSFLPLKSPAAPAVENPGWVGTPVDKFILAKLTQRKLTPSPAISATKLVRRIYFDLIGLPPTPAQIDTFVEAYGREPQAAVESLVDGLLASAHYGERWARHWLDVARYADSNGQEGDQDRPTAYHYRDFVIRALNDDLPYDTFVRWQVAGDEIEPHNPLALAATGFIVAGPHTVLDVPMEEEKVRNRFNELDDMLATTGAAMLGLTLGCARCHDHKYDAVPTLDYYRLLCAFNAGNRAEVPLVTADELQRQRDAESKWKTEVAAARKRLEEWLQEAKKPHEGAVRQAKLDALKISPNDKALLQNEPANERAGKLVKKFAKELQVEDKDYRSLVSAEQRQEWDELEKAVKTADSGKPKPLPTAHAFADFAAQPRETFLLARGDFHLRREPVKLGFLTVLTRDKTAEDYWTAALAERRRDDSSQQRRAVAEWITDTEQGAGALLARVMVNRIWQHHFGEGLVRTVNDFGVQGDMPSHPELLEWLTAEFVRGGWRLKPLHRLIVTSAVYRQDSVFRPAKAKVDPDNRLLWRRRPQRIESEILRDAILAVSGSLNREMFGPAFKPPIAAEAIQARNLKDPYPGDARDTAATRRRTVYMFHKRVVQHPLMQAFDGPDASASCGRRENTTVAPQALALLNDRFLRARAEDFARRLANERDADIVSQVRLAWRLALGREPFPTELESAAEFINAQTQQRSTRDSGTPAANHLALTDFCQAIFALNEFVYID